MPSAQKKKRDKDEAASENHSVILRTVINARGTYSKDIAKQIKNFSGTARLAFQPDNRQHLKRYGIAALIAGCILIPVITWINYQAKHVVSTNAIVRGHVSEIGSRLTGIVTDVDFEVGDRVSAGDLLAQLEDSHIQAEALEASAVLDGLQRQYEIELLEIEHERKQIDEQLSSASAKLSAADAESTAARIRAEEAARSAEVRRELFIENGAISGEIVKDAVSEQQQAAALLQASVADRRAAASERNKSRLAIDAVGIRERKIGILEAEIRQAQARLAKAEADLAGTGIRAPADGAIIRRIVEPGGSVDAGQSIISMRIGSDVWVEAWIDEKDLADVDIGNSTTVMLQSFPDDELTGKVTKVGISTDFEMPESDIPQPRFARMRGTPVVGVRIQLDDPPEKLVPGLSATVAIRRTGS